MKEKKNVYPEISWSQLRRRFTPGFEDILDHGVQEGWYDIGDTVHKLTFRWLFTPWLQVELDAYRSRINNSKKRRDKNKILPHGVPDHMSEFPELYGALDFKVTVEQAAIERARELYAPRDHPVFQLVPQSFEAIIVTGYESLGSPTITRKNIWSVYRTLVDYVYAVQDAEDHSGETLAGWSSEIEDVQEREVANAEIDTLTELVDAGERSDGSYYMGGVGGGAGLEDHHENQLDQMLDRDEPMVGGGDLWEEGPPPRCVMFSEDEGDFEEGDWEDDIY
ncbi:hypothetical protein ONZ45_g15236 [Pleurotus djamor]|nr:hypothetical protein ONZ45_g15236 [Pleurotus djamor]